ncbi:MAG: hypothetical protein KAS32_23480 [Candidatus Peribacteraceae bacterium]|nr:hypothetical protein [Candidatus Peribacteraceae bacterium]
MAEESFADLSRQIKEANKNTATADTVKKQVELALKATASAYETGSKKQQKESINLAKQLQGQISKDYKFLGDDIKSQYSGMLDQVTKNTMTSGVASQALADVSDTIKSSLPDPGAFVGALVAANPIVSFGVNSMKKMWNYQKTSQDEADKLRKDEASVAKEQLAQLNAENTAAAIEDPVKSESELLRVNTEQLVILKKLAEAWDISAEELEEANELQKQANEKAEITRLRGIEASREGKGELDRVGSDGEVLSAEDEEDLDNKGLFGIMAAWVAIKTAIMGVIPALTAAFGGTLLATIKTLTKFALRFTLIFSFVKGFLDASNTLEKDRSLLTATDRIISGIYEIVRIPLDIIDYIAENLLGIKTDTAETVRGYTKQIAKTVNEFIDAIPAMWTQLKTDFVTKREELYSASRDAVQGLTDSVLGLWSSITNFFTDAKNSIILTISNVVDSLPDPVELALEVKDRIVNYVTTMFTQAVDGLRTVFDSFTLMISDMLDKIPLISNPLKETADDIRTNRKKIAAQEIERLNQKAPTVTSGLPGVVEQARQQAAQDATKAQQPVAIQQNNNSSTVNTSNNQFTGPMNMRTPDPILRGRIGTDNAIRSVYGR